MNRKVLTITLDSVQTPIFAPFIEVFLLTNGTKLNDTNSIKFSQVVSLSREVVRIERIFQAVCHSIGEHGPLDSFSNTRSHRSRNWNGFF